MPTSKNTEPIILIILTSIAVYSIVRSKKFSYLGKNWKHHIITPSMKALRIKSIMDKEVKRVSTL